MQQENAPMVRAQLLLTPAQRQRLERIAKREGRSLSDVARRALDAGLAVIDGDSDEALRRELQALEDINEIREQAAAQYGVYPGNPVDDAREERMRDMERVWRGQ